MIEINKEITVVKVIKKGETGLTTAINGKKFIGTGCLFLREDLASNGYITRISKLDELKELDGKTFEKLTNYEYYASGEDEVEPYLKDLWDITETIKTGQVLIFKTPAGNICMNYNYYSYFKKLGVQFRFRKSPIEPIGMFKDDEFVGIVLPIKLPK